VKWDEEILKEVKVLLKNMIDESCLSPQNIKFEQCFTEPHQNLVEFVLIGAGTIKIEVTGWNLNKVNELFNRLEKDESGSQ